MQGPDYSPTPPREQIKPGEQEEGFVTCEACLKQIPKSIALRSDAEDYVRHFCGLECYNEWRKRQSTSDSDPPA